jgi:hypothetical protein
MELGCCAVYLQWRKMLIEILGRVLYVHTTALGGEAEVKNGWKICTSLK